MSLEDSENEVKEIFRLYKGLAQELDPEFGLGGKLLFAGELDLAGQRLIRAANVAGAASLGTAPDAARGRQAMREGVIDFLVNSLDEALRILKIEVRKRQAVAVGVTGALGSIAAEMVERGVLPDLLPPGSATEAAVKGAFIAQGARRAEPLEIDAGKTFLSVSITPPWAHRVTEFEGVLLGSLDASDHLNRRWLRLSPRYLPRALRNTRSFEVEAGVAAELIGRVGTIVS